MKSHCKVCDDWGAIGSVAMGYTPCPVCGDGEQIHLDPIPAVPTYHSPTPVQLAKPQPQPQPA